MAEVLGQEHVIVGVTPVRSVIAAPGRLRHMGGIDPNLTLGEIDNRSSARVEHLRTALTTVQVTVHVPEDIQAWLWWKFVGAATLGGIGAVARVPTGVLRQLPRSASWSSVRRRKWWRLHGRAVSALPADGYRPNTKSH